MSTAKRFAMSQCFFSVKRIVVILLFIGNLEKQCLLVAHVYFPSLFCS